MKFTKPSQCSIVLEEWKNKEGSDCCRYYTLSCYV